MNVTVRFGSVAVWKKRFRFMRFGFSDGGTPTRAAGEGPPTRGSTQFGSLGPEACEKGTPTRAAGEGPPTRGSTQFGSLGPEACENVLLGRGPSRGGVHNSGVWGLKLAKQVLPRVLLGRGPPRGGVHNLGVWGLERVLPRVLGEYTRTPTGAAVGRGRKLLGRVVWGTEIAERVNLISDSI